MTSATFLTNCFRSKWRQLIICHFRPLIFNLNRCEVNITWSLFIFRLKCLLFFLILFVIEICWFANRCFISIHVENVWIHLSLPRTEYYVAWGVILAESTAINGFYMLIAGILDSVNVEWLPGCRLPWRKFIIIYHCGLINGAGHLTSRIEEL